MTVSETGSVQSPSRAGRCFIVGVVVKLFGDWVL